MKLKVMLINILRLTDWSIKRLPEELNALSLIDVAHQDVGHQVHQLLQTEFRRIVTAKYFDYRRSVLQPQLCSLTTRLAYSGDVTQK